jgi:hypothetical protein
MLLAASLVSSKHKQKHTVRFQVLTEERMKNVSPMMAAESISESSVKFYHTI